ncbi:MAG: glycosyltransferase, partial [Candidatus Omnitrophica bacterium]|nr:glycosyltransferase [Candidatus Omnitrophota bacterium]
MKLSILIPVYNEEKLIRQVTEHLIKELELNHIDYEIVLVNDNSTDKTLQILEELSLKYSNLKVV